MKRTITLMLLAAGAFALTGCDQVKKIDEGNETGGGGVPTPVQERLTASCAIPGGACHVNNASLVDLSEASAGAWVEQSGPGGPYVTFGDPAGSYLVSRLTDASAGSIMPLPPGVLAPEDLAVIVGWVAGVEFPSETGPATTTDGETTDGETTEGETTEGGGGIISCALSVVDPDAESPVVSGDGAGVIPSSIGTALEENCGCHYTDSVSNTSLYFPYSGGTQLQTLENFTSDYAGANSTYAGMAAWVSVQDRVITQATMPTAVCETEEGGIMSAADFALFEAWFEQGVPDGASFTPPG
ncbi:MAG: hypothetical protein ACRBN8_08695 [Nannocystales bacterium]